jgi:hypothetical protein
LKAFKIAGHMQTSRRASILAGVGAFRSDEPNEFVGGERPNAGAGRLNDASAEVRAFLAESAARDG